MLTPEQQKILQAQVLLYLLEQGGTLLQLVGLEVAGEAPRGATAAVEAGFVVSRCNRNGALALRVLENLDPHRQYVELVEIWVVAQTWQQRPPQPPFSALTLADDWPFVDREDLRSLLRSLLDGDSAPILLVNGEIGMGKSYSTQLIREEADLHDDLLTVPFSADPQTAAIWEVDVIATEIAGRARAAPVRPPTRRITGERKARNLAEWTAYEVGRCGRKLWLVFDGFDHQDIPEETQLYLNELLAMMGEDERMAQARILLFDFDSQRLGSLTNRFDSVALHFPSAEEVSDYFRQRFPGLPGFQWATAAEETLEGLEDCGPLCMPRLRLKVKMASNVLAQQV